MADIGADDERSNQRVTNALILNRLEATSAKVDLYMVRTEAGHADHETRIREMEKVQRAIEDVHDHEMRLRHVETTQQQLKERVTWYAAGQATLSAVLAAIAGVFGARN